MGQIKKVLLLLAVLSLVMYHGCVVKAQRIEKVRKCSNLSDADKAACDANVSYGSIFFDFQKVFNAQN